MTSGGPVRALRASQVAAWDAEADVVVVGLGAAGACAAIAACEAGASVLALEREAAGGGTSALSGGLLYLGGGTPVQKACGFEDSPGEMLKFLRAACGPGVDEEKVAAYCAESVAHFDWLVRHGVPFKESFCTRPSMEAPGDDCLVFSGGEDAFPFDRIARSAPRAHKPQHAGAAGGFLMQRLLEAAQRAGMRAEYGVRGERLVVGEEGRVVGVVATRGGARRAVRASRGVVLAAGGFASDAEMLARHAPRLVRCDMKLAVAGDDGRAIRMAMAAGADVAHLEAGEVALPIAFPSRLAWGILVSRFGQRYVNEDTYAGRLAQETLLRQDGEAWFVADESVWERRCAGLVATHVEDSIASAFPGQLGDHLPDLHDFAGLGADGDDHALGIGPEFGEGNLVLGEAELRLGGLDLGLGGLTRLERVVISGARREAAIQQMSLPLVMILRLGQLTARGSEIGFGRAERVAFIDRVEPCQHLSGFDHVAPIDQTLDHPSGDPEAEACLVACLENARENDRDRRVPIRDDDRAHRPDFGDDRLRLLVAGGQEQRQHRRHQHAAHPCDTPKRNRPTAQRHEIPLALSPIANEPQPQLTVPAIDTPAQLDRHVRRLRRIAQA